MAFSIFVGVNIDLNCSTPTADSAGEMFVPKPRVLAIGESGEGEIQPGVDLQCTTTLFWLHPKFFTGGFSTRPRVGETQSEKFAFFCLGALHV